MLTLDTVNITDAQSYTDNGYPWAHWDLLRDQAPVFWYQQAGLEPFWAITKHEDMSWISRNPDTFSSGQRVSINTLEVAEMFAVDREQRAAALGYDAADPQSLTWMDPPLHHQVRKVMAPVFMPRTMARLEESFNAEAVRLVDEFLALVDSSGSADVASDLASRLPVAAICEIIGVPEEDREQLFAWTVGTMGGEGVQDTFQRNVGSVMNYLVELVQKRMASGGAGGEDIVSRLAAATVEDRSLEFPTLLNQTSELLFAGNGTTRNVIAGGIRALLEHPDQLRLLAEHPELLDGAVEEILRWTAVAVHMARTCVKDTEIRGVPIRRGQTVALWYPSANRDEAVFEDPYRFDITRTANPHFAFGGHGAHFCLGANLAKVQLRAMFRAVVPVLSTLVLDGPPRLTAPFFLMTEYQSLRVRRA